MDTPSSPPVPGSALRALRARLGPDRVLAEPDEIDAGRRVWNAAVTTRPAVIARCTSAEEVATVVRVAVDAGVPVAVRGGGHDFAGRSVRDGAVVVDLSLMRDVRIRDRVARVGGGATVSDVLDTAQPYGLAAVTGTIGTVGMAGLLLGGGYGRLLAVAGLAVDNLVAAQVVLADGRIVEVDEDHAPDLKWALQGAGGNFGVVTRLDVALHPFSEVTAGMIAFPLAAARTVFPGWLALSAEAPDQLTVSFGTAATDAGPVCFLNSTWSGPSAAGERWADRLRALGEPVADDVARTTLAEVVRAAEAVAPAGRCYDLGTRTLTGLPGPALEVLLAAAASAPSPLSGLNVHHARGVAARTPQAATAFGQRGEHLVVEIIGQWEGDGAGVREWVAATARSLEPFSTDGGWPNVLGPAEDARARRSYGPNAARIVAAKERWDPRGIFSAIAIPR